MGFEEEYKTFLKLSKSIWKFGSIYECDRKAITLIKMLDCLTLKARKKNRNIPKMSKKKKEKEKRIESKTNCRQINEFVEKLKITHETYKAICSKWRVRKVYVELIRSWVCSSLLYVESFDNDNKVFAVHNK